jgi:aryl sulfotransferase
MIAMYIGKPPNRVETHRQPRQIPAHARFEWRGRGTALKPLPDPVANPAGQAHVWPVMKARDIYNHHMDSTRWNTFNYRDGDIVIGTYAKSGTTWTQQIVSQLIFNGAEDIDVHALSPWIDMRIMPPEAYAAVEAQTHRRFVKTHLPANAIVFSPKARYIYIGRDGRDMLWSLHHHMYHANDQLYDALNNTPGRIGPPMPRPPEDVVQYFREWLERDGYPLWSFWENIRTWWTLRDLPNVKLIHFNDLKRDLAGTVREIAAFLNIAIDEAKFPAILEHCSFDYMKAHADKVAPLGGVLWEGGAKTFINRGVNGRWKETLPLADSRAYERRAMQELGPACARWLAQGAQ